jgi:hypothetical protein
MVPLMSVEEACLSTIDHFLLGNYSKISQDFRGQIQPSTLGADLGERDLDHDRDRLQSFDRMVLHLSDSHPLVVGRCLRSHEIYHPAYLLVCPLVCPPACPSLSLLAIVGPSHYLYALHGVMGVYQAFDD